MKPALAGAQIVSIQSSADEPAIYYTLDGTIPTDKSIVYLAPFLVASSVTVKAIATHKGTDDSAVVTQAVPSSVPSGSLVWSDEFTNTTGSNQQPDPAIWGYNTGNHEGYGNHELETYCAWNSSEAPCDSAEPNTYIGTDSVLHIVARHPAKGVYTSARLKTESRFSFAMAASRRASRPPKRRACGPPSGLSATTPQPPAGPERASRTSWSVSTPRLIPTGTKAPSMAPASPATSGLGTKFFFPKAETAAGWHTYGMIWKKDSVAFYDDPAKPYVTYIPIPKASPDFPEPSGPSDHGDGAFVILNLAVGGDWPKSPDAKTPFPAELLVDYVRLYAN